MNKNKDFETYNELSTVEENKKHTEESLPPAIENYDSPTIRCLDKMTAGSFAVMKFLMIPTYFIMPFCGWVWKDLYSDQKIFNAHGIGFGYLGFAITLLFPLVGINVILNKIIKKRAVKKNCNTTVLNTIILLFNFSIPFVYSVVQEKFFTPTNISSVSMVLISGVFSLTVMFPMYTLYTVITRLRKKNNE